MHFTIDAGIVLGMLGVGFSFVSFAMKRMLTLRVLARWFIGYGVVGWLPPSMVLNAGLVPVNARRLWTRFSRVASLPSCLSSSRSSSNWS